MTVNVDLSRVENEEELWTASPGSPEREIIPGVKWLAIAMCLHTGMSEITAKTEREVYARFRMLEGVLGAFRTLDGQDWPVTFEEIRRLRGLRVNASLVPATTFTARVRRAALDIAREEAQRLDKAA